MSTKTENIKNFINKTGKDSQLFLFVGNTDTTAESNSIKTEIDTWKDSDFSIKIGKDNLIGVVPNNKWVKKRSYTPWNPKIQNNKNFYVYNESNGYVYLCLSDNLDNRSDLYGQNVSNNIPYHSAGDLTYSDGYTWKALYKITPSLQKFVTEEWIPVVSFDLFEDLDRSSLFTQITNFCSPYGTKDTGKCYLYFSKNFKYYDGNGNLLNAVKGNLYQTFSDLQCFDCYNIFNGNPNYVPVFNVGGNSISIKDSYDVVGEMIDANKIGTSSPYYYLYQVNKNSPDEGYLVSLKIDLSSFTQNQLEITKENPELTILSNTGSGAVAKLKTFKTINGKIYIKGIDLVAKGSNYKDISFDLSDVSFLGGITKNQLLAEIEANLDEIDGLGFDPMKVLNVKHTMIDVKIDKPTIESSSLSVPSSINFYTLVENPLYTATIDYVAGTTENKYTSTLYRTTTQIAVRTPSVNPQPNKTNVRIVKSDGRILYGLKTTKVEPSISFSPSSTANVELKGIEYSEIVNLSNTDQIIIDGTTFTIDKVNKSPSLVQYTGKQLSSNVTDVIEIEDVDTAIVRINMVKGM